MDKTTEKKPKKEKKFNGERVARRVEKSLKAVFPNDTFFVSPGKTQVQVLFSNSTNAEIGIFKKIFCELTKLKIEELDFSKYEKKAA